MLSQPALLTSLRSQRSCCPGCRCGAARARAPPSGRRTSASQRLLLMRGSLHRSSRSDFLNLVKHFSLGSSASPECCGRVLRSANRWCSGRRRTHVGGKFSCYFELVVRLSTIGHRRRASTCSSLVLGCSIMSLASARNSSFWYEPSLCPFVFAHSARQNSFRLGRGCPKFVLLKVLRHFVFFSQALFRLV